MDLRSTAQLPHYFDMTTIKNNRINFDWVEPLLWAKQQMESAIRCGVPITGNLNQFQHKIIITADEVMFTSSEYRRILPIKDISYILIDKEGEDDQLVTLIHITHKEPYTVSFALDETALADELLRWFAQRGIETEDLRERKNPQSSGDIK